MNNNIFKVCYNCQDRKVGCHATCEKYREEVEQNEKTKKSIRDSKRLMYYGTKWYKKFY